ncbi:MAG: methyl-accepting chemotaxis protein, partial [Fimbriimonadales bacterium]|nr:methyl-accepting chemotaxis protein [Fimbriimonadales bacterium]
MQNWFSRMSWTAKQTLITSVSVVGLLVVSFLALNTLKTVQIEGPLYDEIRLANDLRADILPPPHYLVEAMLYVDEAYFAILENDPQAAREALREYERAKRDYMERHKVWQQSLKDPELRQSLLEEAHQPAQQFFALVEKELKPAFARADKQAIERLHPRIKSVFSEHRAAIVRTVELSEQWAQRKEQQAQAIVQGRTRLLWGAVILVLAVVGVGSFALRRSATRVVDTVSQLRTAVNHLQQGDLMYRVPVSGNDEFASLLRSYNDALEKLAHAITETRQTAKLVLGSVQEVVQGLSRVAQGANEVGLTVQDSAEGANHLAHEIQRITESVQQVQLAANEVAQGAEHTAQSASAGVERVNLITHRIQDAFSELQQAQQASEHATQITHEGRAALQRSEQVMREIEAQTRRTAQEIQQLAEMSASVSKIVSKIEDIARQINLLSLNAAIEAARAGEAGRGFAVVADEVRRLAERSAHSSQEIQQILEQVVEKTKETVASMEENLKVVQEGGAVSQQVAAGLQSILQAVDAIAEQVRHSAQLMQEVQLSSEATLGEMEQIAAIAEQSSAASEQMLASAETTTQALQQMAAISEQAAANAEQSNQIVQQQVQMLQRLSQNAAESSATVEKLMFSIGRFRITEEESLEEKIQTFKRAHLKWVERVERMVHHGEMIPRDQLVSHKKCALGTWYYSIGQQQYGHLPEFQSIEPPHARLHEIAAQAVEAMEKRDQARAEQCLNEIRQVSQEIVGWLDRL